MLAPLASGSEVYKWEPSVPNDPVTGHHRMRVIGGDKAGLIGAIA
jgi:hypothetical protein